MNRTAYQAQRLLGKFNEKTGQTPELVASVMIYADNEAEARVIAEAMLPTEPGAWLRIQSTTSGVPDDDELRQVAAEQAEAEKRIALSSGVKADGTSSYYVS